jgi:alkylhydroperoxidase family enzyme
MAELGREPLRPRDIEQGSDVWRRSIVKNGEPLNLFKVLAHNENLLHAYSKLGAVVLDDQLPRVLIELAILRVAAHNKSAYEIARHRILCTSLQMPDDLVERALDTQCEMVGRDGREQAVIELADELERCSDVSDELWARLSSYFGASELLSLIVLIGIYRTTAYVLNAARVPMDPDVVGQQAASGS